MHMRPGRLTEHSLVQTIVARPKLEGKGYKFSMSMYLDSIVQ